MAVKHGPWTLLESIQKYTHKTLEVYEDQVVCPDGNSGSFATVRMPAGVCVLPLDDEGFVYLTREFRYALGRESVETMGGVIESGEQPLAAAKRELEEELGIEAEDFAYLGCIDPITSIIKSPTHLFLALGLRFKKKHPDGSEEISTVKMQLKDAVRKVNGNEITHAESCALILKAFLAAGVKR